MKVGSISGSLTRLVDNTSYLIEGANITITTGSNGAITISSTGGGGGGSGDAYFDSTVAGSIFTSGSAAFIGNQDEWGVIDSPADKGTDVFFYVSGSIGSKNGPTPGVSLFSGDMVVSGSFFSEGNTLEVTGTVIAVHGFSGSLTTLTDGTSYLIAGNNITIVTQSNGSVVISSTASGTGDSYFDSTVAGSIFTTGSAAFVDQESVTSPSDKGTDVFFYVSGSIGSKDGPTPGVALFSGDVVVSGSMFAEGNRFEMSGTLLVTEGISGSLTTLVDGTSYLVAGDNISIVSQSNGSILISSVPAQTDDFFDSTTVGSIFTTGSAAFKDQEAISSPADKGTDVFFYVSGSIGSKDGPTPGVALFGGDLAVSGSLFAIGDVLEISGTLSVSEGISGSLTTLTDGTSYLIAGDNISIVSQSNGSILISSTFTQVDDFFDSTTAGSIFTTGSAAFKGQESIDSPADRGTDVFFYVSGSIGSKDGPSPGVALFSGDVVVSGSMFASGDRLEMSGTLLVTEGISGSLTNLTDGTSYLVAGDNISIVSQSNGSILISNTFVQVDDFFDSTTAGSIFTTGSAAFKDQESIDSPSDKGTDVFFYVSGSIGSKDGSTPGVALFGGDVVVSGSMFTQGDVLEVTGTLIVTNGISGSLTTLADGTSYLIAGDNISIVSQSNGSILISNTFSQVDDFFDSTTAGSIFTTGSAAFKGQESIDSPLDKGADVFFYVSGSIGSQGTSTAGAALFGGDLVVSGGILLTGNFLEVTGTIAATQGISGSLTQLVDGTSYLIAGANISITSQSNGAVTISNTFQQADDFFDSTTAGSIFTTGSTAFKGQESIDSPTDKGTDVFFYASGSVAATRSAVSLFGGFVVISGSMVQGNFGVSGGTTGQYSRAHGERTSVTGIAAHAEGRFTLAQGNYSHAEGDSTFTSGPGSHAEGLDSATYASYSHAEGRSTEARGVYSHAEGYDSIPRADYSHAEGRDTETIIGALYSHAEGSGSITLGEASHAGGLCTIASGSFQTVFGKYNLRSNVDSLFIIGNGTADSNANRSDVVRVQPGTLGAGQLQVSGSMSVSGSYSGNTNTLSGAGTIDSAGHSILLTTTGTSQAITLADGTWPGQLKYVVANSGYGAGPSSIITPTNALGYTSVTFDSNGEAVTFFWTGSKWVIVGSYGATITP